jgi:hypothetical protein
MSTGPSPDVLSLVGSQKAEFNHASRLRTWVLRLQLAIGALGGVTVFLTSERWLYLAAIAALVLAGIWLWLSLELSASRSHAERLRRATMIAGGLGMTLEGAEMFELANDGRASKAKAKRLNDPSYFASMAPPGVRRFADMLEESAIWTTNLAGIAYREACVVFGLSFAVTLVALFSGLVFTDATRWQQVARVFFAMLVVLLSADFLGAAIGYDRAGREARRIVDRLQRHKGAGAALEGLMIIFADYNSAVEAMPLFSSGLYPRHEKRLNEEYKMFLTGPQ